MAAYDPRLQEIAEHLAADDPRLAALMRRVPPWTRWRWRPLLDRAGTLAAAAGLVVGAVMLTVGTTSPGIVTCLVVPTAGLLVTRPWTRNN